MKLFCKDCESIYDEDELIDHWYRNSSSHYVEDDIKCKCGSRNLEEIEVGMRKIESLMDKAIKRLEVK